MSFQDAVKTVLTKKYADFSGRARRSEYWWFALFAGVVYLVVSMIDRAIDTYPVITGLVWLALIVPTVAAAVRRLHDTGKSGWFALLGLIPIANIVLLVFLAMDTQLGDNQYGASPKAVAAPVAA